jgi:hypothetical protein
MAGAADAPAGAFGEAAAKGLMNAGAGLSNLSHGLQQYQAHQDRADNSAVEGALAEYGNGLNQALASYKSLQGENALKHYDDTLTAMESHKQAISQRLGNDRQRALFNRRAGLEANRVDRSMVLHQSEQIGALEDQKFKAREASVLDSIRLSANDDISAVQDAIGEFAQNELGASHERRGLSYEARPLVEAEWKAKAYGEALRAMIRPPDGKEPRPDRVQAFFEAHKKDLDPKDAEQLGEVVREIGFRQRVEEHVSGLLGKHSEGVRLPNGNLIAKVDGPAIVDAAEQLKLPEKEKERLRTLARSIATATEGQWSKQQQAVYESAMTDYLRSPTRGAAGLRAIPPETRTWLVEHAPDRWEAIERKAQAADERANRRIRGSAEDRRWQEEQDQEAWYRYQEMSSKNEAEASEANVEEEFPSASPKMAQRIRAAQQKDKNNVSGGGRVGYSDTKSIAEEEAGRLGFTVKGSANKKRLESFQGWVRDYYDSFRTKNKRNPTRDEVREAVASGLVLGDENGDEWFGGSAKYKFETKPGDKFVPYAKEKQKSRLSNEDRPSAEPMPRDMKLGDEPAPSKEDSAKALNSLRKKVSSGAKNNARKAEKEAAVNAILDEHPEYKDKDGKLSKEFFVEMKRRGF